MKHPFIKLAFVSLFLVGCNNVSEDAFYTPSLTNLPSYQDSTDYSYTPLEDFTVSITPLNLKEMMDSKESFCMVLHQLECHACSIIRPHLIRYISETHNTIYTIDIGNEINLLDIQSKYTKLEDENHTNVFFDGQDFIGTPTIYFFNKGNIVKKQIYQSSLSNYHFVYKLMQKYLKNSQTKLIKDETALVEYQVSSVIYYYDNKNTNEREIYQTLLANNCDLYIYPTNLYPSEIKSKIINYQNNLEFTISASTTYAEVENFLNK